MSNVEHYKVSNNNNNNNIFFCRGRNGTEREKKKEKKNTEEEEEEEKEEEGTRQNDGREANAHAKDGERSIVVWRHAPTPRRREERFHPRSHHHHHQKKKNNNKKKGDDEEFGVVLSQGRESGEHVWRTVLSHDRDDVVHRVIVFRRELET